MTLCIEHYVPGDNPEFEGEVSKFVDSYIWHASDEVLLKDFYHSLDKWILERFPQVERGDILFRYIRGRAWQSRDWCLEYRMEQRREAMDKWEYDSKW